MRRLLRRKVVTIVVAIISFATIPAAGIVAPASPALASSGSLCNGYGYHYCADTTDLSYGSYLFLTIPASGALFNKVDLHFTCCGGHEVYRLQFAQDTARCIGVPGSSTAVTVRECSGGNSTNVNWAEFPQSGGGVQWFSNSKNMWLASDNHLGHSLFVTTGCSGCYLNWFAI
jgi:hypothetical protein